MMIKKYFRLVNNLGSHQNHS